MDDLRTKVARALDAKLAEVGGAYLSNDQATDAILNLIGGDGWKPIETAPKDGEHVLLFGALKRDFPTIGFYHDGVWWAWFHPGQPMEGGFAPTHWMPLPASPPPPVTP